MTSPGRRAAVLAIFVLSGAAALIDEIVWSRQLVLVFGNTTQAVSAILTGFFGGMAIGAFFGGRVADRVRSPLRMYGILEIVLAVVVILTPLTFALIRELYRGIYPALAETPQALALVRFGLSLLALAPATILMGATLPSLTRYLTRAGHPSAAFGRLYAANTIGAILGTLAAGLVLIELFGLSGALAIGAAFSAIAGVAALILDRGGAAAVAVDPVVEASVAAEMSVDPPADAPVPEVGRLRLALAIAFVSGLTSLGYQVLWTRLLASGTGNTTYVFTVILGLFLTGLAIGAVVFSLVRPRLRDPIRLLATSQLLTGALAVLGLIAVISRPRVINPMMPMEAIATLIGIAVPVVLITTIVMGLTLPAASMLLPGGRASIGRVAGMLLAVNTVGSILGSFIVPFVFVPAIGSPNTLVLLALVNVGMAVALSRVGSERAPSPGRRLSSVTVVAAALVVAIVGALITPGVISQPNEARLIAQGATIFESTEDEIATVEAGQLQPTPELWVAGTSMTLLTVDAKLMPLLPLAARPAATDALIVAFGMGSSFRTALTAGLRTDVVELVPSVPAMFGYYHDDAAAVVADPNGRIIVADGRNHMELTDRSYDIILTDPPPPIESAGASVISSLEYYKAGLARLKPDGIIMQWIPFGSQGREFHAHLRTFTSVYPYVTVAYGPGGYGTFVLGSAAPISLDEPSLRAVLERPGVLDDLRDSFDNRADDVDGWVQVLEDAIWMVDDEVRAFAGSDGPLVTDDRPYPEYFLLRRWLGEG